jgi:hypothetical protein
MAPSRPSDEQPHQGSPDELLRELEAAWEQWIRGNPPSDAQTTSLLRAAFAAGYQAGHDAAQGP